MNHNRPAQRILDLLFATAMLLIFLPIMFITMVIVMLGSKGPVIYRSARIGRNGRKLVMYKFRTMHSHADAGPRISSAVDPRVVPGGRLLRSTKVDELPQLLNILRGEMSLVGPRPEDPDIVQAYYGDAERKTLAYRPGLTSPGSLWYYTEGEALLDPSDALENYETVMRRKLAIDTQYAQRATVLKDLGVLVRTGALVMRQLAAKTGFVFSRARKRLRQ